MSAQTGRERTVGHSESSFSFHISLLLPTPPPLLHPSSFPEGLSFKSVQLPVSAGAWVGFEQAGGFAAAEGGPG